jgi:sarcosine oxidase subunit beta
VRCTFAEPINVRISLFSTRYYMQHAAQFDFRQRGYLWMYDDELWDEARQTILSTVRSFDLPVEELSPRELLAKFPILTDVSDVAGATFTPFDGRLSPHRLRIHYLNHAQAGGVEFLDRWQVVHSSLIAHRSALPSSSDELQIQSDRIINAAGPWASQVARLYGRELPVTPHPRQVFLLRHERVNLEPLPFFIDYPQDIYFRHYERDRRPCTLVSWSDPAEPDRIDFSYENDAYFRQHVEPRLLRRIESLRGAELAGGWVGHYELTPDKSAIVGGVPDRPGLFNYNGLSAHGVMQSRGLGEAMAGLLIGGAWPSELNLDALNESRFAGNRLAEKMYV